LREEKTNDKKDYKRESMSIVEAFTWSYRQGQKNKGKALKNRLQ
jgi:hypothetical protein